MNELIGKLIYKITGDTAQLNKSVDTSDKKVKGLGKTLSNLGKLIKGAAITGVIIAAGKTVANFAKTITLSASDAEETGNKFAVVFKDIKSEADAVAENLRKNYGLSSTASKTLISDTGDLLTGFGFTQESALGLSEQVNKLAVDLASFTNFSGGAAGASQALTKALLGERESVKSLGISILETDVKAKVLELTQRGLTFATERQAKAFATLEIATEQSKNAIGDFERSSDSFANQQRIAEAATEDLKEALGVGLLPLATQGIKAFGNLASEIAKYVTETREAKNILEELRKTGEVTTDNTNDLTNALSRQNKIVSDLEGSLQLVRKGYTDASLPVELQKLSFEELVVVYEEAVKQQIKLESSLGGYLTNLIASSEASVVAADAQRLKNKEDAEAAELAERLAAAEKDTLFRREVQAELLLEIAKINEQVNAGLIEGNGELEKEEALRDALNKLIDEGFTAQGRGFAIIKQAAADFGVFLEDQRDAEQVAADERLSTILSEEEAIRGREIRRQQIAEETAAKENELEEARLAKIEEDAEKEIQIRQMVANTVLSGASQLFSALDSLNKATLDNQLARLEEALEAELEAQGLLEETNTERLERELEEAIATGDAVKIKEAQDAIDRNAIKEQFEKKRAQLEYQSALTSWRLQLATATATGAQAILNGFASVPFLPVGLAAGALATVVSGLQIGAVAAAKPQAPSFQNGGIIPGTSFSGDNVQANVNSGEMVLNAQQQEQLFSLANGGGGAGIPLRIIVNLNKKPILDTVAQGTKAGTVIIDARSVK